LVCATRNSPDAAEKMKCSACAFGFKQQVSSFIIHYWSLTKALSKVQLKTGISLCGNHKPG
jgi:hypothetical protein